MRRVTAIEARAIADRARAINLSAVITGGGAQGIVYSDARIVRGAVGIVVGAHVIAVGAGAIVDGEARNRTWS